MIVSNGVRRCRFVGVLAAFALVSPVRTVSAAEAKLDEINFDLETQAFSAVLPHKCAFRTT